MRYSIVLLFLSLFTATAFAQIFSIGVKGGARLTDDLQSRGAFAKLSESKRYTVGPAVQFRLPYRLSVEVDALYRRVGTRSFFIDLAGDQFSSRDRSNSWEFPILAKYRILRRLPAPYVSGGYAFRHIAGSGTSESSCCINPYGGPSNPTLTRSNYSTDYKNSSGLAVGGGMEFRAGFLHLSPEFRYTRWLNKAISEYGPYGYFTESAQNQAEILLGVMWRGRNAGKP